MIPFELVLAGISVLLIFSIIASKASSRFGIPSLLLFLFVGMLAGSEGLGRIHFDDPNIAQYIGITALIFILFSGGLDTEWKMVRPLAREGVILSTIGVLLTASLLGCFIKIVSQFSWLESFLLGSIVSSTDAAAVFSMLNAKKISLTGKLKPLLELESGSNDPMAVFLTVGIIGLIVGTVTSIFGILPVFVLQMGVGGLCGYFSGKAIVFLINKIKLEYDGLYPVFTVALIIFTYVVAQLLKGNGFLAVYIAGIVIGNRSIVQKRYLIHFHSGLSWLMQITMFLTLGLLVFPSKLIPVALTGFLTALFLMLIARPASIFASMFFSDFNVREKLFVSWVGLRGSVPIILAIFPLIAGIEKAEMIFNIVFFIVITSAILQGTTISLAAKLLKVESPIKNRKKYPIEFDHTDDLNTRLLDLPVPYSSWIVGRSVLELGLPSDSLITLIARNDDFVVPGGKTLIEEGDVLLIIVNNNNLVEVQRILAKNKDQ